MSRRTQKTNAALNERNPALKRLNRELAEAADYVNTILPPRIADGSIRTDRRFVPSTSLGAMLSVITGSMRIALPCI
ncbi:MAG: hypothetical protein R3274_04920 [Desulfobacterales bacterium]|nr:hypothetical protein [Desulfobacterales bacterium]